MENGNFKSFREYDWGRFSDAMQHYIDDEYYNQQLITAATQYLYGGKIDLDELYKKLCNEEEKIRSRISDGLSYKISSCGKCSLYLLIK